MGWPHTTSSELLEWSPALISLTLTATVTLTVTPTPTLTRCRQLEPAHDRQPLTSRTARLTRASGEGLARAAGSDVSEGSGVWWRLATEVLPAQLRSAARIYERMPKESPTKLKLL